jgi:hypothetical protein
MRWLRIWSYIVQFKWEHSWYFETWLNGVFKAAGLALLYYDYLLTLSEEITHLWNTPWTRGKALFYIVGWCLEFWPSLTFFLAKNRYLVPIDLAIQLNGSLCFTKLSQLTQNINGDLSSSICQHLYRYSIVGVRHNSCFCNTDMQWNQLSQLVLCGHLVNLCERRGRTR